MYRAALSTLITLGIIVVGALLLANGVTVGGHAVLHGLGGLPSLTTALLHPTTPAELGSTLRATLYLSLGGLALWLALRALVLYLQARDAGYRLPVRVRALLRQPLVRQVFAISGTALVTVSATGTTSASAPIAQAPRHPTTAITPQSAARTVAAPHRMAAPAQPARRPAIDTVRANLTGPRYMRIPTSLRYTVQPGDTLWAISQQIYSTPARDLDIFRATLPVRQFDGAHISNPNELTIGWSLYIPFPAPHIAIDGDHVLYIVQPGDTASAIARSLTGDWRQYENFTNADGTPLANPSRIFPGQTLRVPGARIVYRLQVRPGPRLRIRPAGRAHVAPASRHTAGKPPVVRPTPVTGRPAATARHAHETHPAAHVPMPDTAVWRIILEVAQDIAEDRRAEEACRAVAGTATAGALVHHRRAVRPSSVRLPPRRPIATRTYVGLRRRTAHRPMHRRLRIVPTPTEPTSRTTLRARPTLQLPWSPFVVPTVLFALFFASVAVLRRRTGRGPLRLPAGVGSVAPSMLRSIWRARSGAPARVATSVQPQVRGDEGPRVAYVVEALEQAAGPLGLGTGALRMAIERQAEVELVLHAHNVPADRRAHVAAELGKRLGVVVTSRSGVDSDGTQTLTLTIAQGPITRDQAPAVTPAPLLVPVGYTTPDETVYINLARAGATLLVGATHGTGGLVKLILTSIVMQAKAGTIDLLVASADPDLKMVLPATGFLRARVVDPADTRDLAALIELADNESLERFAAEKADPAWPALIVLLDGLGAVSSDEALAEKVQALAMAGAGSRIHLLATSSHPDALAEAHLLVPFRARLAYRLSEVESTMVFGDETVASSLGDRQVVIRGAGSDQTVQAHEIDRALMETMLAPVCALAAQEAAEVVTEVTDDDATEVTDDDKDVQAADGDAAPIGVSDAATGRPEDLRAVSEENHAQSDEAAGIPAATSETAPASADALREELSDQSAEAATAAYASTVPKGETALTATAPPVSMDDLLAPDATARLRVNLLGGVFVLYDHVPLELQPQQLEILSIIALLGPQPVPSETIAAKLSSRDGKPRTVSTISKAITKLRAVLAAQGVEGDVLVSTGKSGYRLNLPLATSDFYLLKRIHERLNTAPTACKPFLWERYVDAYTDGLWILDPPAWVEAYREQWRKRYHTCLRKLAGYYDDQGQWEVALAWYKRWREVDPTNEHCTQQIICVAGQLGRLDEVKSAYAQLVSELDAVLGTTPSKTTEQYYERWMKQLTRPA